MATHAASPQHEIQGHRYADHAREACWTIAMSKIVNADAQRISQALTMPEYLEAWICMPGQEPGSVVVASETENGFRLDHWRAGKLAASISGSFLFCHLRKLRFSWKWTGKRMTDESVVDFRIRGNFGSSILELSHTGIGSRDEYQWHRQLWQSSMEKLACLLRSA